MCEDVYFDNLEKAVKYALTCGGIAYPAIGGEWYVRVYEEVDRT